nr:hypothetical protein [Tanacetum cinerariifolium]
EFILGMGLHTTEEMDSAGFGTYWAESMKQIPDKGDLSATSSFTSIRDLTCRLCYRLTACNIAGRSQALEKVTVTDLFYLRGIIAGRSQAPEQVTMTDLFYLRDIDFIARLAEHFGLLTEERLQGLTVIVRDLPVIDITELVRLQICEELVDTWAWVAPRLERQPDVAVGALVDARGAFDIDEGAQAIPAPTQAPQPPLATGPAQTMAPRLARVEEERRRVRQRTGEASTLAAPLDKDQPDL